jgi:hypothetical protein
MTYLPRGLAVVDVGDDEAGRHDKSHASPDELGRWFLTECGRRRLKGLLVHGSRLPTLFVFRTMLRCFKPDFFGEALQMSEKIFEMYPDGRLVWPAIPF